MKSFFNRYLVLREDSLFFFLLLYLILVFENLVFGITTDQFPRAIMMGEFYVAYVLTLLRQLTVGHRLWSWAYTLVVGLWVLTFYMIDFYCLYSLETCFTRDVATLIIETNSSECTEFLHLYFNQVFSTNGLISFGGLLIMGVLLGVLKGKKLPVKLFFRQLGFFVAVGCLVLTSLFVKAQEHFPYNLFLKTAMFFKVEEAPDLTQYLTHPKLDFDTSHLPKNVVFVIGESLTKHHCSLYGYAKPTNPSLVALRDSGDLLVYNNVTSPDITTANSFKYFMSTYAHDHSEGVNWYECTTLPEVFNTLGYTTTWLSNQQKSGFHDHLVTKYAQLCDSVYFCAGEVISTLNNSWDEVLLTVFDKIDKDTVGHNLYFFHFIGSHPEYSQRYPEEWKRFSADDYLDKPAHQRETYAHYDNSVVYNDHVVAEIIRRFADTEAVVIYFSDHGVDFYQTDSNYAAHARNSEASIRVGKDIPFVVYTSSQYRKRCPDVQQRLSATQDTRFSTENFLYLLMDIVGAQFKDNADVQRLSPLEDLSERTVTDERLAESQGGRHF